MRVFQAQRTRDEAINRNLDAIANSFHDLGSLPAVLGLIGGTAELHVASSFAVDDEALVIYRGGTASTMTLPGALSLGNGVCRVLFVWNDSTVALTVAGSSGDRVSGSTTIASAAVSVWASDGISAWVRVV